jgi:hypothetical protein
LVGGASGAEDLESARVSTAAAVQRAAENENAHSQSVTVGLRYQKVQTVVFLRGALCLARR